MDNIRKKMTPKEEIQFISLLRENKELFKKVFGNDAIDNLFFNIAKL